MANYIHHHHKQSQDNVNEGIYPPKHVAIARAHGPAPRVVVTEASFEDRSKAVNAVTVLPNDTFGKASAVSATPGEG